MANKNLELFMVKEIIRLKRNGESNKEISKRLSISRTSVIKYVKQMDMLDISYDELIKKTDEELYAIFSYQKCSDKEERYNRLQNHFPYFDKEIKRVGVSRWTLWCEYKSKNPDCYSYSQFCYHYQQWCNHKQAYMHIDHKAGDKLFVDYAGKKLSIVDKATGEIKELEVFLATLGASQMTYVEASENQRIGNFIKSVENALWYFGGVPRAVVPDNLKSAVTKSNKYEPTLNDRFADFSSHYDTSILPARSRKPKDKSLVEGAVRIVYHRIYSAIRNDIFYSKQELNNKLTNLMIDYNNMLFQGKDYSRKDLFTEIEYEALQPLPTEKYEYKQYKLATVQKNCHVYMGEDKNYYSVPFKYIGKKVKIIYTSETVEIYYNYKRIALHRRIFKKYTYTTIKDHLPSHHKFVSEWSSEKFIKWASDIGEETKEFIEKVLRLKKHPEQAYKSCLGILTLERKVGKERLNKACSRALYYQAYNYKIIKNILERGLEDESITEHQQRLEIPSHENIRGKDYYHYD